MTAPATQTAHQPQAFRVHCADGTKLDVMAETADNARRLARQQNPDAKIERVKIVKGEA